jgi:hypothetical protein
MEPIRVNAGGAEFRDSAGNRWAADYGFAGGESRSDHVSIANTADEGLYQSTRSATGTLEYSFQVPAGRRIVTLKFSENGGAAAESRAIDITINGIIVAKNFNVASAAGGRNRAVDRTFEMQSGGGISIQLSVHNGQAAIAAIEIR